MPSGPGYFTSEGFWVPGEADIETYASDHLQKMSDAADTQAAADRLAASTLAGRVTTLEGKQRLGGARRTSTLTLSSASTWTDVVSLTATSNGGLCLVDWKATIQNAGSGATRVGSWRVLCDGVVIGPTQLDGDVPNGSPFRTNFAFDQESTPAAASHTWKLQALCTTASALQVTFATMTVYER